MDEAKKLLVTIAVFVGIGLLLLGGLFYQLAVYGWGPIAFEDAITIQSEECEAKLAKLEKRNGPDRAAAVKTLEMLEGMQDIAKQLLPDDVNPAQLLNAIANKGKGLVQVVDLKPVVTSAAKAARSRGVVAQDAFEPITYNMTIQGSFDDISTFINVMEMFELPDEEGKMKKQFFAVQGIKIEADNDGMTESGNHTADLKLVTFRYVPVESPTAKRGAGK